MVGIINCVGRDDSPDGFDASIIWLGGDIDTDHSTAVNTINNGQQ